jgi:hypothetical protein
MSRQWRPLTVPAVDGETRFDDDRSLSLRLEVRLDAEPISGRLRTEAGADERFVGWLGFVDALKRLQDQQDRDRRG